MKLFFNRIGDGPPLLILHGLFGSGDNWLTHARALASRYTVFLVDQRNHGRSPHEYAMNYDLMAADLLELLADQNLRDVALMGHSMGGKTVMRFCQSYPMLVGRLIVVDMGIRRYDPHHDRILEGLQAANPGGAGSRAEVEERLSGYVSDSATLQFLMKNLYRKEGGSFAWRFNLPSLRDHIGNILAALPDFPKIDAPACFIRGELSGYIPDEDFPAIRALVPRADLLTIPAAGHWPHAERPDAFLAAVNQALES